MRPRKSNTAMYPSANILPPTSQSESDTDSFVTPVPIGNSGDLLARALFEPKLIQKMAPTMIKICFLITKSSTGYWN